MQKRLYKIQLFLVWSIFFIYVLVSAQEIRWLSVTDLQSQINEIGAEFESEFSGGNLNFFSWPVQYSIDQNTTRAKGLWIGSKNFHDPFKNENIPYKVVASGPRDAEDRISHIFKHLSCFGDGSAIIKEDVIRKVIGNNDDILAR